MRKLSNQQKQFLQDIFAERVNFEMRERRLYAHDVGTMPAMMQKLTGSNTPAAIVQPLDEEELSKIARWAQENRISLVPRGKATSGYGGAVPVQGAIVVEFNRMKKVLDIDTKNHTITVQGGAVWQKIEQEINEKDLTLNSYPTSAPASTVAGWLATGGAGIGSYQAGYFRDSVLEVTMVLPDGELRVLSGEDLALVENASGISGFITQVKFKVKDVKPLEQMAFAFDDLHQVADFIKAVDAKNLPLWSLSFINPETARYRNKLPVKAGHGHTGEEPQIIVPEKFVLMVVYNKIEQLEEKLGKLAAAFAGQILDKTITEHEWNLRFSPMKAKRISPSLIPAEVVVPLSSLEAVLRELGDKIKLPFLLEGFAVKGSEIVLLGFIPHDERKFGFNIAFGLSLTVLKIAIKNGGRAYGCGLYFSPYAEQLLGKETVSKIKSFKAKYDKNNIMNPGKTIDTGLMARMIQWALPWERPISIMANKFPGNTPGETYKSQKGIAGDIAWFAYSCAQCGYCIDDCTAYYGRGWESQSPRGKWSLLKMVVNGETKLTQDDVSDFLKCTTCEVCHEKCQLELPIEPSWYKLRGQMINEEGYHSFPAFHIMEASARKEMNIWAHYAAERDAWVPDDIRAKIKDKSDYAYFPGCTSSYVENDIAESVARLIDKAGMEFTYLGKEEACCGIPMLMAGRWDAWEEIMDHNVAAMKKRGATTIITTCPACRLVWNTFYRRWMEDRGEEYNFVTKHYTEIIAEKIADGSFKMDQGAAGKITYHDPCHMGRAAGIYEQPRELLKAIPGIDYREMKYNRDKAHCCGSVLTLVDNPDIAAKIGQVRLDDALEVNADTIITACPCCRVQLKATVENNNVDNLKIRDLATFVAEACGFDIPDSTPVIDESWATFDIMIKMMTPNGMAEMMAEMLPDMIDAMPAPMAGMMRWMKKQNRGIKGPMLAMMKPLMPKLFPVLLPAMLPKVMPVMLEMVKQKVPMADFMEEQLADLMTPSMAELMPKMLPEILPHFMPLMEEYLLEQ